jgi:DNA-binding NtrC family response regulator
MTQAGERIYGEFGAPAERAAIVFISASAEDARAFRELVDGNRWLVVNVPDLIGAWAVIDKLRPRLVVCDTRIEGRGSWRDLLSEPDARPGFALVVACRHAGAALRPELLNLGGIDVLEKPFAVEDVERVIGLAFQRGPEERGVVAGESVPYAAPCSRRG